MSKKLFVDAETDGLYGQFLSVAAIVLDDGNQEIASFYKVVDCNSENIQDDWTRENVYPLLGISTLGQGDLVPNENQLLTQFWEFCEKYTGAEVIADVTYPVECRLFEQIVRMDLDNRKFKAPFPLMDLSSMLYAKGIEPLKDRYELIGDSVGYTRHNALDDVRMSIMIWKKYIIGGQ